MSFNLALFHRYLSKNVDIFRRSLTVLNPASRGKGREWREDSRSRLVFFSRCYLGSVSKDTAARY